MRTFEDRDSIVTRLLVLLKLEVRDFAVVFIVFSVFLFSYSLTCLWFFSVTKKYGSVD